ncbi:hypothetical protein R6Q57_024785 [Mikania cordata]
MTVHNPIDIDASAYIPTNETIKVMYPCYDDNRKQRILNTIRNSEELREGAIEQLEKARARLRKVEIEADEFHVNGYSEIEREKLILIDSTYKILEQLENYKNETINFEQQKPSNQVRQRVFQQALQGALGTLNSAFLLVFKALYFGGVYDTWAPGGGDIKKDDYNIHVVAQSLLI